MFQYASSSMYKLQLFVTITRLDDGSCRNLSQFSMNFHDELYCGGKFVKIFGQWLYCFCYTSLSNEFST